VLAIKYLFWNIYKKNLLGPLLQVILESSIDVVALVESENLDVSSLINELKLRGQDWKLVEMCPVTDIRLVAKQTIHISVHQEGKRFSAYKIVDGKEMYLLDVVHLSSPMHLEEEARNARATNISQVLRKIEENVFENSEFKSIIVGDFNLQPYSQGISGVYGFNATMSVPKAKKIFRIVDGEPKYFYFNPTWKLMGDNKIAQGTYYNNSDQQERSMFWYSFDEVLVRPYFIDKFNWEKFGIIEKTDNYKFVSNEIIDKCDYSDHLPIRFEIL
jgi:hypothetical protein